MPIAPPRVDSSKDPHRVNRAHWPTKENAQNFAFSIFPVHGKNGLGWPQIEPGVFFPTNPDLADILGRMDLDFGICLFLFLNCWIPNFWISRSPDLKIPRFPDALTPLPTHPGIKYVARALATISMHHLARGAIRMQRSGEKQCVLSAAVCESTAPSTVLNVVT